MVAYGELRGNGIPFFLWIIKAEVSKSSANGKLFVDTVTVGVFTAKSRNRHTNAEREGTRLALLILLVCS